MRSRLVPVLDPEAIAVLGRQHLDIEERRDAFRGHAARVLRDIATAAETGMEGGARRGCRRRCGDGRRRGRGTSGASPPPPADRGCNTAMIRGRGVDHAGLASPSRSPLESVRSEIILEAGCAPPVDIPSELTGGRGDGSSVRDGYKRVSSNA
jgi:hypothetical protein